MSTLTTEMTDFEGTGDGPTLVPELTGDTPLLRRQQAAVWIIASLAVPAVLILVLGVRAIVILAAG